MAEKISAPLTSGRLLARNTVWNLVGMVAPLAVAVPAVPRLIHAMGTDRFGVLTLAWVVVGYFSLFDFGFGRALTKLVAEKLASGAGEEISALFWTSLILMILFGAVGAVLMGVLSPWLVHSVLRIPATIQVETIRGFYLLALSLPVVIATTALRGFLEAHQRFLQANAVRIPLGVCTFAGPLLVLPFSVNLLPIIAVLVLARFVACIVLCMLCVRAHPDLTDKVTVQWNLAPALFRFGGWMTLSNIVSPLMVSLDRFLVGAVISISAVAYYATPSEAITRLLIIPSAIAGVLFPAFSSGFATDLTRTRLLFLRGFKYTALAMFPVLLVIVVFAREGLALWVGQDFAQHSATVLQWLAIGVFFNGVAQIPFVLVQGVGRPDLTGKLHLAELPAYAALLWFLVHHYGIVGAAIAWTLRVAVDAAILFLFAGRLVWESRKLKASSALLPGSGLTILVIATSLQGALMKGVFASIVLLGFAFCGWFLVLSPEERELVQEYV